MKKRVLKAVCAMLVLLLALTACGHQTPAEVSEPEQNALSQESEAPEQQAEEQEPAAPVVSEVTADNFTSFPETDEAAFEISAEDDGWLITYCDSTDAVIVIPETIYGKPVVGIDGAAFFQNDSLVAIVLPDTVEKIGRSAFQMCANLKYVDLGNGLKSTGSSVFGDCTSLTTVTFPEGMTTFSGAAFVGCDALTDIYIPASVTEFPGGILDPETCPNAVVVTPVGSAVETYCVEDDIPYRNS